MKTSPRGQLLEIGKWKRKPVRIQRVYSCNNYERPIDQRPAVPRIVTNVDWQNSLSQLWPEACVCVWWKYLSRWCIFYRFTNISWKETFKLFCWYMNITSLECQAALTSQLWIVLVLALDQSLGQPWGWSMVMGLSIVSTCLFPSFSSVY